MALAQTPRKLDAVVGSEADVEEHGVDALGGDDALELVTAPRLEHTIALELQVHPAEEAERRIVVCDYDRGLASLAHRRESNRGRPARDAAAAARCGARFRGIIAA